MRTLSTLRTSALLLSLLVPVHAAAPESGELNAETPSLAWDGSGPYAFTNVTPAVASTAGQQPLCQPGAAPVCDQYQLTVNLSDDFRALPENQRQSVKVGILFPASTGQEDYDLYMYDEGGALVGKSDSGGQEAFSLPLKQLKNGNYTVNVIPYAPLGTNYTGYVELVGKQAGARAAGSGTFGGAFGGMGLMGLILLAAARRLR